MDDTGGNSGGPATFAEAFAADASPASGSTPNESSTTPPAAEQPATTSEASPQQGDERSPFIPRSRFDEVNTERNALKQWREQYAWAENVDQQAIAQAQQLAQLYSQDRAGYVRQLLSEAMSDPQLAPAIRSEAARLLGTRQQQAQPTGPDLSQVVIDLGNGQTMALSDLEASIRQKVMQEMQPVMQTAEEIKALREQAVRTQEAQRFASGFMGDLSKLPQFDAHKGEIAKQLAAMTLPSDHPAEVRAATLSIYLQTVLPKLSAQAQSQLLDNLQQKAAASTSVNPTSAAPSAGRKVTSFNDPSLQW